MSEVETKAWGNVSKAAYAKTTNMDNIYTKWANEYDEDIDTLGYLAPENIVKEIVKYVNNSPTSQLLDVGAGTGRCGELLKKHDYIGVMDALEINGAMLDVARSKKIYRGHYETGVFPDKEISLEYGLYDGIISAGTFLSGHAEAECVAPLVRALKPGGYAVWNTRDTDHEKEYRERVAKKLDELVKAGEIEKVEEKLMQHYAANCRETGDKMMAIVYVYRKL